MAQCPLQVGNRWCFTLCLAAVWSSDKSSARLFALLLKRKCCVQWWKYCTHFSIHTLFTVSGSSFLFLSQLNTLVIFQQWSSWKPNQAGAFQDGFVRTQTWKQKKKTLGDTAASPGDSTACLNYPHVSTTRKGLFKELPGKPQQPERFYKYSHRETRRNSQGPVTPTRQRWSLCHVWPACWWGAAAVAAGTAGVSHRPWSAGGMEREGRTPGVFQSSPACCFHSVSQYVCPWEEHWGSGPATVKPPAHQTPRRARYDIIALTMFSDCDVSLKPATVNPQAENKVCPLMGLFLLPSFVFRNVWFHTVLEIGCLMSQKATMCLTHGQPGVGWDLNVYFNPLQGGMSNSIRRVQTLG